MSYTHGVPMPPTMWPPLGSLTTAPPSGSKGILYGVHTSDLKRFEIIAGLINDGYWVKATGSRVTKDGWSEESDWDYVVYDPEKKLLDKLTHAASWTMDGSGNGTAGVDFNSFKSGNTNLILVSKESVWKNYIIATNLIRAINPKTKKERVEIFDSVFGKDSNSKAVDFTEPPF